MSTEHTKTPWGKALDSHGHNITTPVPGGHVNVGAFPKEADRDRAVACVNGCDAAGIANPEALKRLLAAAKESLVCRGMAYPGDRPVFDEVEEAIAEVERGG